MEKLEKTILELIPEGRGQYPLILLHQIHEKLGKYPSIGEMQQALDNLYIKRKLHEKPNVRRSIIRKVYKV